MPDRQLKGKKNTGKAVVSLKKNKKNNKNKKKDTKQNHTEVSSQHFPQNVNEINQRKVLDL